jgi:hypothetical protein
MADPDNSGIFEIREFLDSSGSVAGRDVVDISKEMEMMAKVCGGWGVNPEGEIDVRRRFSSC